MKVTTRLILALLTVAILTLLPARAEPADYDPENPAALTEGLLFAESALLLDMDTGEVLLSKNSRVRMYPASTTKIMTMLLALESGIPLDQEVVIPKEAGNVPEGSSVVGIKSKDRMTWEDLLYGLMLRSGNDASNAIAVLTAGSIDAFVQRMNERALQLNCEGTHYTNAHGYHNSDHYTTAQDLARIALYAMRNETFRRVVAAPRWQITVTRGDKTASTDAENRNSLVVPESNYYYPDATGIKTGHHNKAGRCVVASAERDGVRLMAVVMKCETEEQQFTDAKRLFEYGFSQYSAYSMAELLDLLAPEICAVRIENAAPDDPDGGTIQLRFGDVANGEITRMLHRDSESAMGLALNDLRAALRIEWNRGLTAPVSAGEVLGNVRFEAPDGSAVSADLIATRDVAAMPTPAPTATQVAQTDAPSAPTPRGGMPMGALVAALAAGLGLLAVAGLAVHAHNQRKRRAMLRRRARRRKAAARRRAQSAVSREKVKKQ